jgi:hypothetical protein
MRRDEQPNARYGIEIRGTALHAEANDLASIDSLLNDHAGQVCVFDRQARSLLIAGTVEEVRRALGAPATLKTDDRSHEPE